jgi:hypothetical protein
LLCRELIKYPARSVPELVATIDSLFSGNSKARLITHVPDWRALTNCDTQHGRKRGFLVRNPTHNPDGAFTPLTFKKPETKDEKKQVRTTEEEDSLQIGEVDTKVHALHLFQRSATTGIKPGVYIQYKHRQCDQIWSPLVGWLFLSPLTTELRRQMLHTLRLEVRRIPSPTKISQAISRVALDGPRGAQLIAMFALSSAQDPPTTGPGAMPWWTYMLGTWRKRLQITCKVCTDLSTELAGFTIPKAKSGNKAALNAEAKQKTARAKLAADLLAHRDSTTGCTTAHLTRLSAEPKIHKCYETIWGNAFIQRAESNQGPGTLGSSWLLSQSVIGDSTAPPLVTPDMIPTDHLTPPDHERSRLSFFNSSAGPLERRRAVGHGRGWKGVVSCHHGDGASCSPPEQPTRGTVPMCEESIQTCD